MAPPLRLAVESTFARLLEQEDTDRDKQITVKDEGPRRFELRGEGGGTAVVEGTYPLSNLLQELALAREAGQAVLELDPARLHENPVRRIDAQGLARIVGDTKAAGRPRLYVPATDPQGLAYFTQVARERPELGLDVVRLPEAVTAEYAQTIDDEPGLLSLALADDGKGGLEGLP